MKKWSIIMAMVMALIAATIVPISTLAQTDDGVSARSATGLGDGLAIVAPLATPTDTEISISVFKCSDQEPVRGASVWLVTREKAEVLRQEMSTVGERDSLNTEPDDYESLLNIYGILLGKTDGEGKVWHSFDSAGSYTIVAVMRGYLPDSRQITVGMRPKALAIDAPDRARVGEDVTITVLQRGTSDPVKDAGVWAFTRENAESMKALISGVRESADSEAIDAAVEEACNVYGIFLGTTNGAGKVKYAFEKASSYLLVTFKRGYFPGWKPIVIISPPTTDALERPDLSAEGSTKPDSP